MTEETLAQKLNRETAKTQWGVLAPFYAQGRMVGIAKGQDLIETAIAIAEDNAAKIKELQDKGLVFTPTDDNAKHWHESTATLWALVVNPWVLVQEV